MRSRKRRKFAVAALGFLLAVSASVSAGVDYGVYWPSPGAVELETGSTRLLIPGPGETGVSPADFPDRWKTPKSASASRGAGWIYRTDSVWFRFPIPHKLAASEKLSVPVYGDASALFVDDRRMDLGRLAHDYALYTVDGSELVGHTYLYVEVRSPSAIPSGFIYGPSQGYLGGLRRYAASDFTSLPERVQWVAYDGELPDVANWQEQRSSSPEFKPATHLAIRFTVPASYRGALLGIDSYPGTRLVEVLLDGKPYYTQGYRASYRAAGVLSLTWMNITHFVALPDSQSRRDIEIRFAYASPSAYAWIWKLRPTINRFVRVQPTDVSFAFFAAYPGPIGQNFASLFLVILSIIALGAAFTQGRIGKSPFLYLSAMAFCGAVAVAGGLVSAIFASLPLLRLVPPPVVIVITVCCDLSIAPLLVVFLRRSTETGSSRIVTILQWALGITAAGGFLVGSSWGILKTHIPSFVPVITFACYLIAAAIISIQVRRAADRRVGVACLVFAVLIVCFVLFRLPMDTGLAVMSARVFLPVQAVGMILVTLPLLAVPFLARRRIESELR